MPEKIYKHSAGLILIEEKVVDILNKYRQHGKSPEAGGILIGYKRTPHIHIVACTTPFKLDKRSMFGFFRKDPQHKRVAKKFWKNTQEKAYYIGEWHTHPVKKPSPSFIDINEWRKLMKSKLGEQLVFIIVGRSNWYVQMGNKRKSIYLEGDDA